MVMSAATAVVTVSFEVPGQAHDLVFAVYWQGDVVGLAVGLHLFGNQVFAAELFEGSSIKVGIVFRLTGGGIARARGAGCDALTR